MKLTQAQFDALLSMYYQWTPRNFVRVGCCKGKVIGDEKIWNHEVLGPSIWEALRTGNVKDVDAAYQRAMQPDVLWNPPSSKDPKIGRYTDRRKREQQLLKGELSVCPKPGETCKKSEVV